MKFNVVHIFSTLNRVNFGIWNAGIFGSTALREKYGVRTVALICTDKEEIPSEVTIEVRFIGPTPRIADILDALGQLDLEPSDTVVVSHGSWLVPSQIAYRLRLGGYRWIYTPHGMLESWSLRNGRLKKFLYWRLREGPMVRKAHMIRAVGKVEKVNLSDKLRRSIALVENGVTIPGNVIKDQGTLSFLFMARLHHKKGIRPLVEAWRSVVNEGDNMKLTIAGPDEGELKLISGLLNSTMEYVGPVYGTRKDELLRESKYYILPSFSEGFPTSVLEGMSYGLIPLISKGCNFPEVFDLDLGYDVEPDVDSIARVLSTIKSLKFDQVKSSRNVEYITTNYSESKICDELFSMYADVMKTQA